MIDSTRNHYSILLLLNELGCRCKRECDTGGCCSRRLFQQRTKVELRWSLFFNLRVSLLSGGKGGGKLVVVQGDS